jgi:DNA polymerase elongation subunit (family B)
VSYIGKTGQLEKKAYPWNNPTRFDTATPGDEDAHPHYRTWDGKPVVERTVRYPNRYGVADFMDSLPQAEQDAIFGFHEPDVYFVDIETEVVDGFPTAKEAATRVLNIAVVMKSKILVMGLQPLSDERMAALQHDTNAYFEKFDKRYDVKYYSFQTEYAMLHTFFNKIVTKAAVMTGWNFVEYDWVFLVNRARNIGVNPDVASPSGRLIKVWSKPESEKPKNAELPQHRVIVDYMELYSKWDTSIKIKDSSSLDFVAEQVLGVKKLTYDGTIQQMHDNDYYKYTLYNIIDTVLVQLIHEKRKYLDIMLGIATLCRVRMLDAYSTIRTTEGVLRGPMRKDLGIVFVREYADDNEYVVEDLAENLLKGGWVKDPNVGMNLWVAVYDFASLYPTTMRQNNIAPESYRGVITKDPAWCVYQDERRAVEPGDIVTTSGAVFRNEESVTKKVLTDIYFGRTTYKNQMKTANIGAKDAEARMAELAGEAARRGLKLA